MRLAANRQSHQQARLWTFLQISHQALGTFVFHALEILGPKI
jgi:hypothetical protein